MSTVLARSYSRMQCSGRVPDGEIWEAGGSLKDFTHLAQAWPSSVNLLPVAQDVGHYSAIHSPCSKAGSVAAWMAAHTLLLVRNLQQLDLSCGQ
eukprot:scaffold88046_cov29-Attheya_sp.AAC.1